MTAYLIIDADTDKRLAGAHDAITAEDKARTYESMGHRVRIATLERRTRLAEAPSHPKAPVSPPVASKRRRRPSRPREEVPMRFYDLGGTLLCRDCRDDLLTNAWRINVGYTDMGTQVITTSDEPPLRPRDFEALGDRPWAGKCDNCNGQWGPDA
jgi:hypothetical protein